MKTKKLLLLFVFGTIIFTSCNNSYIDTPVTKSSPTSDSTNEQKIIAYVNKFANLVDHNSSTRSSSSINVYNNISKNTYSGVSTRTGTTKSANVYTLEFTRNGKKGFAIACMDSSIDRVFAYTENGNLSDTTYNVPLNEIIASIPQYCIKTIRKDNIKKTRTDILNKELVLDNLVKTEWDQDSPYNDSYPCLYFIHHAAAGCGIIATSQAIAYYGTLGKTSLNSKWPYSQLTKSPEIFPNDSLASTVATYVYSIAQQMNPSYGEETETSSNAIQYPLNTYGIKYYYHNDNMDKYTSWQTLIRKDIIIARGYDKKNGGHVWLYTGMVFRVTNDVLHNYYNLDALYVNWGWGGGYNSDNGWYYSDWESPANKNVDFNHDNRQYYIEQMPSLSQFNYSLLIWSLQTSNKYTDLGPTGK